ncbi:MAG: hypothetical protein LUH19_07160 [Lachnospiraceae bacterium]|nr:hypothetical protein [Lachnospiraceae bacterium]
MLNIANLNSSEMLVYGGIALMVLAVFLTMVCLICFHIGGRRLKRKLEQEYGKPVSVQEG